MITEILRITPWCKRLRHKQNINLKVDFPKKIIFFEILAFEIYIFPGITPWRKRLRHSFLLIVSKCSGLKIKIRLYKNIFLKLE